MAQYRTVTEFLRKIREEYNQSRNEYTALYDKIERLEREKINELNGCDDMGERTYISVKYEKMINDIKAQIDEQLEKTYSEFDRIKDECEGVFGIYNRPTGDKVDLATVELLKSGILNDDEIKALAKDFDGNCAMRRIIGQYAYKRGEETKNQELRVLGSTLRKDPVPYKEPIETLIFWSQKGLRKDRVLSDGIAKVYDEQADKIFAEAEGISVEVEE